MSLILAVLCCSFVSVIGADEGQKILDQVSKSAVRIMNDTGMGSGFFINETHIVTNHHVVSNFLEDGYVGGKGWWKLATNTMVEVSYSAAANDIVVGRVVQDWPEVDLAVVAINEGGAKRTPIKLQDDEKVKAGINIYTIGFPGVNSTDFMVIDTPSITAGVISKISRDAINLENGQPYLQLSIDSLTNPGNSGGPIVDRGGNVVGITNSGISGNGRTAYFGIHVHELVSRLDQAGIKYQKADSGKNLVFWVIIGFLAAAIVAVLYFILRKNSKKEPEKPKNNGSKMPGTAAGASIQGVSGQFSGIEKLLSTEKDCVLGTNPEKCTMVFEKSVKKVSRVHCRIHFSKTHQRYVIQDLNSTNGTIIIRGSNKRKVPTTSGIALENGDIIQVPDNSNSFRVNL